MTRDRGSLQHRGLLARVAGIVQSVPRAVVLPLIRGSRHGDVSTEIGKDEVVQRQTMLPSSFECLACKLKISGISKLSACGLGDAFTATSTFLCRNLF